VAPRRVLLIDDDDDIRTVARLTLELVGNWDVLTASSGIEGLQIAEDEQPDAIVLDVMMPVMDGAATYRRLQANPATRHIPVFLLTAKVFESKTERDGLEGLTVLAKPFDPLRLPGQLATILGWMSAESDQAA
jgi:two-component system, OmpR family, alkaline phosphatase synthesis response regulator PhoP